MKFNPILLSLAAGLTLITVPQAALAQNTITVTGGSIDFNNLSNPTPPFPTVFTTGSQGTFSGSANGGQSNCTAGCSVEIYGSVAGSGFSPAGPVLFSNVPAVAQLGFPTGTVFPILSGTFNSTTVVQGSAAQSTIDSFFSETLGITGPVTAPDFSVGQFHFTDPSGSLAQNFSVPEQLSIQAGTGQAETIFQGAQQQQQRPNGIHTRIMPTWTPGLYQ